MRIEGVVDDELSFYAGEVLIVTCRHPRERIAFGPLEEGNANGMSHIFKDFKAVVWSSSIFIKL